MRARDTAYCQQLLSRLADLAAMLNEQVPVVDDFLSMYLQQWNGVQFRQQILQLITHTRLRHFEGIVVTSWTVLYEQIS